MSTSRSVPPTAAQRRLAAQRSAAARERLVHAHRRRQYWLVGGSVVAVVLVAVALVVVKVATGSSGAESGTKATAAGAAVISAVENVPAKVLDEVGTGTVLAQPQPISASSLTGDGKPEVMYVGAEYCPYCAAQRWAFAVALSRFGTFHDLGQTSSSPTDSPPSLATLTFHGATYTSRYLTLVAKEIQSNQVVDGQYAPLDRLSTAQNAVVTKYDAPPYTSSSGGIPFIDYGGRYVSSGAGYDNQVLVGRTHAQIADALSDPGSAVAQAVDGTANSITATLCTLTGQQPSSVCTSSGVTAAAAKLPAASTSSSAG